MDEVFMAKTESYLVPQDELGLQNSVQEFTGTDMARDHGAREGSKEHLLPSCVLLLLTIVLLTINPSKRLGYRCHPQTIRAQDQQSPPPRSLAILKCIRYNGPRILVLIVFTLLLEGQRVDGKVI